MNKEEVRKFIDNGYAIQIQAKEMCIDILKNELGGSVSFDWEDNDAPSISSTTFDDDLTDAYITRLYMDGDVLKADLHAYYIGMDADGVSLYNEYETNYLDILDYLNNLRDGEPDDTLKHTFIDTKFGEVMLKGQKNGMYIDVYNGNNYDNFIGEFRGNMYDDSIEDLTKSVEELLGGND